MARKRLRAIQAASCLNDGEQKPGIARRPRRPRTPLVPITSRPCTPIQNHHRQPNNRRQPRSSSSSCGSSTDCRKEQRHRTRHDILAKDQTRNRVLRRTDVAPQLRTHLTADETPPHQTRRQHVTRERGLMPSTTSAMPGSIRQCQCRPSSCPEAGAAENSIRDQRNLHATRPISSALIGSPLRSTYPTSPEFSTNSPPFLGALSKAAVHTIVC